MSAFVTTRYGFFRHLSETTVNSYSNYGNPFKASFPYRFQMLHSENLDKHLLTLNDLKDTSLTAILQTAADLKLKKDDVHPVRLPLKGKLLVLYFEKKSTRTRLSCTAAWSKLGGTIIDMSPQDGKTHIGVNETIYDSFRVIADMSDCIVARVNSHLIFDEIRKAVNDSERKIKPFIINGLSDMYHPLQTLADILTMCEICSPDSMCEGLRGHIFTWIGDGNNVCNSLVRTLPRFDVQVRVCCPPAYNVHQSVIDDVKKKNLISFVSEPVEAVRDANFIATDTWISMGNETEKHLRMQSFKKYRIDKELIENGKPASDWTFLHCLPRKQHEVSDEIFYGKHSRVWQESENRLWTTMAVFLHAMEIEF